MPEASLPRLTYVGDVPVEASYHGSALLYRLLERYPADRLLIVEGNLFPPATTRRLPGVRHATVSVGYRRLLNSRLHRWYSRRLLAGAASLATRVERAIDGFPVEAVLTVAHGYLWLAAARFAERHQLPLHLIVHDDWPRIVAEPFRQTVEREFARVYRQAMSRLCVSPFMADEYERRYGMKGTVLLPSRAHQEARKAATAAVSSDPRRGPVFAFAGTINSPGYATLLRGLAELLRAHHGRLLIYGPLTGEQASGAGLTADNIALEGLLSSGELVDRLRRDADVLFVPMSFAPSDRWNMRMSFPSKLTDYTAVGLPLLICGPAECSAVRWAEANPGVAEVVTSDDPAELRPAVERLCHDRDHRARLARAAAAVGNRDFAATTAESILHAALVA
jgi:glycosyltransferase involved in cell wall biosynthesis